MPQIVVPESMGVLKLPLSSAAIDVTYTTEELAKRSSTEVMRLVVENEQGLRAIFWVSVAMSGRGRPQVIVATKPGKEDKQTAKKLVGTCNRL